MQKILLNPGPTNTSFWTKFSQWFGSDVCHRTDKFSKDFSTLQSLLLARYGDIDVNIAIMGGSGTLALESMISTLCPDNTLFINAGSYGKRALEIAARYSIKCSYLECRQLEDMKVNNNAKHVYFVENETSTGEHFSLAKMCDIYPNAKFFIDATSSFGASDYSGFHDRIAAISFCSNKCLQSTPGLGVVLWGKHCETRVGSYYGDLSRYGEGKLPFTIPVQSVYALISTLERGNNNKQLFDRRRGLIIREFQSIGIDCLNQNPSNSIIAFRHPYMNYNQLKDFLYDRGIVIYSGIANEKNSFRLSTMSTKFDKSFRKIRRAFNDSCVHRYGCRHVSCWPFKFDKKG